MSGKLPIKVEHEWDQLNHCVMGTSHDYYMPVWSEEVRGTFPYGSDLAVEFLKNNGDKRLSVADKALHDKFFEETETYVETVKKHGVKVERNHILEKYQDLDIFTQVYMRDPIIVVGKKVIVTNMLYPPRRHEQEGFDDLIKNLEANYDCEVLKMPQDEKTFLEGGDIHVNGYEIYCGHSGNASSAEGIEWLQKALGPKYRCHTIPLKSDVLHLDCCMMLLNHKQGIICWEDLQMRELPGKLAGYKWVEVDKLEAKHMATNGMSINATTVIMDKAHPRVIGEVKKLGITVIELPYEKGLYLSGSFRCTYQPLHRGEKSA
eukprot:Platyproteum_vivax@DN2405_c0_g1_i1.p1